MKNAEAGISRPRVRGHHAALAGLLVSTLCVAGCASVEPVVRDAAVAVMPERPVVIFVSGITGSVLYDREEGRIAWGDSRSMFFPRDRGYTTARPIGTASDRIEARDPILEVPLGPLYRREVYGPLVSALEANGYARDRDLFLYGYDWRKSNVESARGLAHLIGNVGGTRPVVLICQSNGGYLCRWAVRLGDTSLEEAERGSVRPPEANVRALVFLGTTHAGSVRILREIDRGRTYVAFGRFLSPETFFTFESLYQDLPPWRDDLFVDEAGNPINVDLFDAATWERFGWSIFRGDAMRRADERTDLFGDRESRLAFLQRALDDARRFHAALRDAPPPEGVRYYSIQNRSHRTIDRAMLVESRGTWQTLFAGDEPVDSRPELATLLSTFGDLHAGVEGQEALPDGEKALLAAPVIEVDGDHLGVIRSPAGHRAILAIIRESGVDHPPAESRTNASNAQARMPGGSR